VRAEVDGRDPEPVGRHEERPRSFIENDQRAVSAGLAEDGRTLITEAAADLLPLESAAPGCEESVAFVDLKSDDGQSTALAHELPGFPTRKATGHSFDPVASGLRLGAAEKAAEAGASVHQCRGAHDICPYGSRGPHPRSHG
jgi:hypothetical protein